MKALVYFAWGLLSASSVTATEINLPPHLEIVSRDSVYISILDRNTGLSRTYYCPGEPKLGAGWDMGAGAIGTSLFDTCFSFNHVTRLGQSIGYLQFGDADHDGLPEISGLGPTGEQYIFEYSGNDTLYELRATVRFGYGMDYAADTDGDGKEEMMLAQSRSMTLCEAADRTSLPVDSVFAWPWNHQPGDLFDGRFSDLNGDSIDEISFRQWLNTLTILRPTGDNEYEAACIITAPESLTDNYYEYVWGDFDSDGRTETVWTGGRGWILTYEKVAPDSYAFVSKNEVGQRNAFWIAGPADFDRDAMKEFYVMSVSIWRGGCFFYGFESAGDNSFIQVWADSLSGASFIGGNLALGDLDGDQTQELVICTAYWIAAYQADDYGRMRMVYLLGSPYGEIIGEAHALDTNGNGLGELISGRTIREYYPGVHYRADMNLDCLVNLLDAAYLVSYFKGIEGYALPDDPYKADVNGNCRVNGIDVTYLINFFKGGRPPIERRCE
jgi:hypothetical protein